MPKSIIHLLPEAAFSEKNASQTLRAPAQGLLFAKKPPSIMLGGL
jgi:hypothetical protein